MHAPAAGLGIDNPQAQPAQLIEVMLTGHPLESRTLVDDLHEQAVFIDAGPQRDRAVPVEQGIGDEFADQ